MNDDSAPRPRSFHPRDEPTVLPIIDAGVAAQERMAAELGLLPDNGLVDHDGKKSIAAIRERPSDCFVAELGGVVVGFMHVVVHTADLKDADGSRLDRYLSVAEIDVALDAQDKKVGTTLLRHADQIARERGCKVIGVLYLENNERSARMVKTCGFTLTRTDLLGAERPSGGAITRFKRLT